MKKTILATALVASTLFSISFEAQAAKPSGGHLVPNNDGKLSWVGDANGNPALHRGHRHRGQKGQGAGRVKLASLGSPDATPLPPTPPQSAEPMGTKLSELPPGLVVSHKTGAHARVGVKYAPRFQAYINEVEAGGAKVYSLGGIRKGRCASESLHPCGKALDVCQLARGVVQHGQIWRGRHQPDCHLPDAAALALIAARHGLFEGGQWCDSDYGHAQVGETASACGARAHHHHRRMAHR